MRISEDVRKYANEHGFSAKKALQKGMAENLWNLLIRMVIFIPSVSIDCIKRSCFFYFNMSYSNR